jgi:hypothetical protein
MVAGALHEVPLNVTALPRKSNATQNDDEEQETDASELVPSTFAGELHEMPLNLSALPP